MILTVKAFRISVQCKNPWISGIIKRNWARINAKDAHNQNYLTCIFSFSYLTLPIFVIRPCFYLKAIRTFKYSKELRTTQMISTVSTFFYLSFLSRKKFNLSQIFTRFSRYFLISNHKVCLSFPSVHSPSLCTYAFYFLFISISLNTYLFSFAFSFPPHPPI